MKRLIASGVALASVLSAAPNAAADDKRASDMPIDPGGYLWQFKLTPMPQLFAQWLPSVGWLPSEGEGLSPLLAFESLRLSLTSTIFPVGGGFPQCETLGDDVGNSVHGIPVQRFAFVRLMPHLTLNMFSSDGCPIDGGMGAGLTYSVPISPSTWLVTSGGGYGVPGRGPYLPARTSAEVRIDLIKETDAGPLRIGIERKSGTGVRGAPGMVTLGGGF
jgi:hypothetical protein